MNRLMSFAATILIASAAADAAQADIVFESATLGPTGFMFPAPSILDLQFLGSRFAVTNTVRVTSVGGHLEGISGTFFAAIVSLSSPTALPSGSPFDTTTVATTTFTAPFPSDDILVPLSATLGPGNYGLIFGTGQFGAAGGDGAMPENNVDLFGTAPYFIWVAGAAWQDNGPLHDLRFVVMGDNVPEPASVVLFGLGGFGLCGLCCRALIGK
jgi:PEP-CTERM motif